MRRQAHLDAMTISLNDGGYFCLFTAIPSSQMFADPLLCGEKFLDGGELHWRWSALLLRRRGSSTGGAFAVTATDLSRL